MSTESTEVYAVIRSGGKQYRVSPGQRVTLERLAGDAGDAVTFDDVLLVQGGGEVAVGTPTLASATVSGEIVEQGRGKKVRVFKYKNKTRYRRLRGHRQLQTRVLVNEVSLGDQSWSWAPPAVAADESPAAELSDAGSDTEPDSGPDSDDAPSTAPETAETETAAAVGSDSEE